MECILQCLSLVGSCGEAACGPGSDQTQPGSREVPGGGGKVEGGKGWRHPGPAQADGRQPGLEQDPVHYEQGVQVKQEHFD